MNATRKTVVGVDTAKNVFQLYTVDKETGGMSKRGDTYLRTLLIHGARAVFRHAKTPSAWLQQLSQRRPPNVVIVALANKIARTIWAVLAHERVYDKNHVSLKPLAHST